MRQDTVQKIPCFESPRLTLHIMQSDLTKFDLIAKLLLQFTSEMSSVNASVSLG